MAQKRGVLAVLASAVMARTSAYVLPSSSPAMRRLGPSRKAMIDPFHTAAHHHSHLEALLSTLYTEVLKHAQGHSQPLFGPPDPILSQGKSIIPTNPNAFVDAGLTDPDNAISQKVAEILSKTKASVVDPRAVIQFDNVLPGFKSSGHILPQHSLPEETPETLKMEMVNVARMMRVIYNLPLVAFMYACVDFFLVQPGYDIYKEELDEDRPGAAVEFFVLAGARLAILSVIGILSLALFEK